MNYSAILFDLDGTLVDSITLYEEAVLTSLKEVGAEATHAQFFDWYVTGLHLRDTLKLYGLDEAHVPTVRGRRDELYIELLRKKSEWLPGAQELLNRLTSVASVPSAPSVPLGLITGSWMSYVDAIDEKLDVKKYFPVIITADEIHQLMKPHPHGLLLAADRLGVDPTQCIYIGDQAFDVEAAERAGMEGILIKEKWTPKEMTGTTIQEVAKWLWRN